MLKNYLLLSDDNSSWTRLPDPESYQLQRQKVEDIYAMEDGSTKKVIRRTGKRQISCTFTLTDTWLSRLAAWNDKSSFYVKFYDDRKGEDEVSLFYSDGWQSDLIRESVSHKNLKGVWNVTLNFIEF